MKALLNIDGDNKSVSAEVIQSVNIAIQEVFRSAHQYRVSDENVGKAIDVLGNASRSVVNMSITGSTFQGAPSPTL